MYVCMYIYISQAVEARVGRTERFRWGPREVDLDVVFYDGLVRPAVLFSALKHYIFFKKHYIFMS